MVFSKVAGSVDPAISSISAACSARPASKAGRKCSSAIRSKGGSA
jgi:hypothetical protein